MLSIFFLFFKQQMSLILMKTNLPIFLSRFKGFRILENLCLNQGSKDVLLRFSSKSLVVLGFTLRSTIHLEGLFMPSASYRPRFPVPHVATSSFQHCLLEDNPFSWHSFSTLNESQLTTYPGVYC